jgi:hypothetical protein
MTEYGHHTIIDRPNPLRSRDAIQEKKEARRKILEAIWQRRRENYIRFMEEKRRLQASSNIGTIT